MQTVAAKFLMHEFQNEHLWRSSSPSSLDKIDLDVVSQEDWDILISILII